MNVKCKRKTNAWLQFVFFPRSSKEEREEKGSESERKRADRTSLKGKQRLVRTIEINRSGNWREDTHTHTHTHTQREKRANATSSLCFLCMWVCAQPTHTQTHIRQAAITHQHPTKKKKKKRERERERERGGGKKDYRCYQHKNKKKTQFSVAGHIKTQRSEIQICKNTQTSVSKFHKRCHFCIYDDTCVSVGCFILCRNVSDGMRWRLHWCSNMPFISFAYYHSRLGVFFDVTFCSGGCGRIHARHGRGPKPY